MRVVKLPPWFLWWLWLGCGKLRRLFLPNIDIISPNSATDPGQPLKQVIEVKKKKRSQADSGEYTSSSHILYTKLKGKDDR